MVVVWIAVKLYENGSESECGFVFPEMVYESNGGYALGPEPKLSAGLVVLNGDFECLGGDKHHAFQMGCKVSVLGSGKLG